MNNFGFRKLIVWQKSMDLVKVIYSITKMFPKEEVFSLTSQMRRAAISIPSNIAEGTSRKSKNDYKHFMSMARGSALELETQIEISYQLKYCNADQTSDSISRLQEIERMLNKLSS